MASHRSKQRMTETPRRKLLRLQNPSGSWHENIVDSRRKSDLHKGDTAWSKGFWIGKLETNTEHFAGTRNGEMGAIIIRRLEPTNRAETSLLLNLQGAKWDLVANAPRRGERKKHPTPALVHENQKGYKSSKSSDTSCSSSSSTRGPSGTPQNAIAQVDFTDQASG